MQTHRIQIGEGLSQALSVLEEGDLASGQRPQRLGGFLDPVLLLKVKVGLELDQRLVLVRVR